LERISRKEFVEWGQRKIGLLLRTYAGKEEDIPRRLEMVKEAVDTSFRAKVDDRQVIWRVDVLIPSDKRYKDCDCGKTAEILREKFNAGNGFYVTEVQAGDNFCSIINDGLMIQARHGMDYSLIMSSEVFPYMNSEVMTAIIDAACNGARAIGIAINELTQSIMEGRIANTFALWHIDSLMGVGGFDLRAAKPMMAETGTYLDNGVKPYVLQGVEEMIPLVRMVRKFGPCIAPLMPRGEGIQQYVVPTDPAALAVHMTKMGTKMQRQTAFLNSVGCDIDFLKNAGIMPEYKQ